MGGGPSTTRNSSPKEASPPDVGKISPSSPYSEFSHILDEDDMKLASGISSNVLSPKGRGFNNGIRRKRSAIEEIRYQAEQTANRAAEKRASNKQEWYPGINQHQPKNKKDKLLASITVKAPELVQLTTNAITIKWAPEHSGGAARIKRYDLQWRVDTNDDHDKRIVEGFVDSISFNSEGKDGENNEIIHREHFGTDSQWHSVPEDVVKILKLEASICGLAPMCAPVIFRIRGRCNAGWGPWSPASKNTRTLKGVIPAPQASSPTSCSFEMKWKSLKDKKYGKIKAYILMGKTDNENDTWKECYTGVQPKVLVNRVGKGGLTPKTTYLFKVITVATHGTETSKDESRLFSDILTVETLGAVPDVPRPPKVVSISHESITVRWTPPCSNGSPITTFHLVGKVGNSQVYYDWYVGPLTKYTVGAARSNSMNISTTRIAPLTEYNVKLAASNGYGVSSYSSPIMVITEPPPDRPSPPRPDFVNTNNDSRRCSSSSSADSTEPGSPGSTGSAGGYGSPSPSSPDVLTTSETKSNGSGSPIRRSSHRRSPQARRIELLKNKNVREIENGWLECWEENQNAYYYFHPDSGSTQWDHPSNSIIDPDLVFRRKRFKFLYLLHQNMIRDDAINESGASSPQSQPVLPLTIDRQQLVFTSYSQLHAEAVDSFMLFRTPKITFIKEEGIDSGGVSKDWFLCLSRAFADPQLCLFRTCTEGGESVCVIDSRSSINADHLEYFRFVGRILGMAIFHRHLVDLKFPRWLYKQIIGQEVQLSDLMETDPVFCKSLKWLLDNEIGLDEPVVDFDFTANREGFGINEVIELIPDGKKTQVNDNNKDLYVSLQLHWRVNGSISSQIKFLKQGFSEVIPLDEVSVFDPNELLLLLNGKSVVVTAEIQIACRYTGGYDKESESIVLFWETFESMSQDERRAILKFATGASRVPLDGFDPEFTITKSEFDANALPSAHTCFNQLVLPPYKNAKNLKEKLLIAVQTVGFQLT